MISVIICTYNRCQSLSRTLQSLAGLAIPSRLAWELVIIDNNSSDDTKRVVEDFRESSGLNVRYLFESQQGLSHARNRGIRESYGSIIAFTDDDVTVDPSWLEQLARTYDESDCLGVGGRVVPVWSCEKPSWLQETGPFRLMSAIIRFDMGDKLCEMKKPPFGANMSFKKAAFERYGLFRADLGRKGASVISGEDTEFGRRLLRNNEKLIYNPGLVVYHPVDEERLSKRYFERWYYNYGRTSIRAAGDRGHRITHLEVQKTLLRGLLGSFLRWVFASNSTRRFYHKLNLCRALGQFVEVFTPQGPRP